jgi:hypothetical protein
LGFKNNNLNGLWDLKFKKNILMDFGIFTMVPTRVQEEFCVFAQKAERR